MAITLWFDQNRKMYIAQPTVFAESKILGKKENGGVGMRWEPDGKFFYTYDKAVAAKVSQYATDPTLKAELEGVAAEHKAALEASRAIDSTIDIPAPKGLAYRGFQKAAVAFAINKGKDTIQVKGSLTDTSVWAKLADNHTLIADPPGAGKTIISAGVINALPDVKRVLVIPPANLRINWQRELTKWLVRKFTIGIIGKNGFPDTDIVICNYDQLRKYRDIIRKTTWDLIIADECHALKNRNSIRTREVFGYQNRSNPEENITPIACKRGLYLTGTPMPNRPIEMWPLVNYTKLLGENTNYTYYTKRYCAAYKSRFGWDVSGASNLEELQEKLRSKLMIRREKSEILPELPPIQEQVIEIPANGAQDIVDAENAAWDAGQSELDELRSQAELARLLGTEDDYKAVMRKLRDTIAAHFSEMAALRHQSGLAKVPHVIEYAKDQLENYDKVVIFAHHHDVIDQIVAGLKDYKPVKLDGRMTATQKQASVDAFQTDKACRVFVGQNQAAGVGLTLTAANYEIIAEADWVPGVMEQVIGRLHRIGQNADMVLVQHLVLEGSLDARMAHKRLAKEDVQYAALDKRAEPEPVWYGSGEPTPTTADVKRADIEKEASTLTPADIAAIHAQLKYMAGMDTDYARQKNGVGFNRYDGRIGHSLAEALKLTPKQAALGKKILAKYQAQLQGMSLRQLGLNFD